MTKLRNLQQDLEPDPNHAILSVCRKQIIRARITLASDGKLSQQQQTELWQVVDAGERFVKLVAQDFVGQLEQIDRELEAELRH